jgi:hypothetical protein
MRHRCIVILKMLCHGTHQCRFRWQRNIGRKRLGASSGNQAGVCKTVQRLGLGEPSAVIGHLEVFASTASNNRA